MAVLRCAEVTLQQGYRYFVLTGALDASETSSFTTPGFAGSGANLKRPAHSRNARDDGTDLGTRSVQGAAL
jgi:hypothetical protein